MASTRGTLLGPPVSLGLAGQWASALPASSVQRTPLSSRGRLQKGSIAAPVAQRASVPGTVPERTIYLPKQALGGLGSPLGSQTLQCLPTQTSQLARPMLQQRVSSQLQSPRQRPLPSGACTYPVLSGARTSAIELKLPSRTGAPFRGLSPPPPPPRSVSPTRTSQSTAYANGTTCARMIARPSCASMSVPAGYNKYVGAGSRIRSTSVTMAESQASPQSTLLLAPSPLLSARPDASPLPSARPDVIRMASNPCMPAFRRDSQSSLRAPVWTLSSPRLSQTREVLRVSSQPAPDSLNYHPLPLQGLSSQLTLTSSIRSMAETQVNMSNLSSSVRSIKPADTTRSDVIKMTPRQWSVPRSSSIVVRPKQADSLMASTRTLEGSRKSQAASASPQTISPRRQTRSDLLSPVTAIQTGAVDVGGVLPGAKYFPSDAIKACITVGEDAVAKDPQKAVLSSEGNPWPEGLPPWPEGVPWPHSPSDTPAPADFEASTCESFTVSNRPHLYSAGSALTEEGSEEDFEHQISMKIPSPLNAAMTSGELVDVVEKVAPEEAQATGKMQLSYGTVGRLDLTYRQ